MTSNTFTTVEELEDLIVENLLTPDDIKTIIVNQELVANLKTFIEKCNKYNLIPCQECGFKESLLLPQHILGSDVQK